MYCKTRFTAKPDLLPTDRSNLPNVEKTEPKFTTTASCPLYQAVLWGLTVNARLKVIIYLIKKNRVRTIQAARWSDLKRLSEVHQVVQTGHTSHLNNSAAKQNDETERPTSFLLTVRQYRPGTVRYIICRRNRSPTTDSSTAQHINKYNCFTSGHTHTPPHLTCTLHWSTSNEHLNGSLAQLQEAGSRPPVSRGVFERLLMSCPYSLGRLLGDCVCAYQVGHQGLVCCRFADCLILFIKNCE